MGKRYNTDPAEAVENTAPLTPDVEEQVFEQPAVRRSPENTAATSFMQAEGRRKSLLKKYKEEEKVSIYLSPLYQPYFGKVMRVMINGISVYIKVDGSPHMIPRSFADEVHARRMRIDESLARQRRLSNVSANGEGAPGELELF